MNNLVAANLSHHPGRTMASIFGVEILLSDRIQRAHHDEGRFG